MAAWSRGGLLAVKHDGTMASLPLIEVTLSEVTLSAVVLCGLTTSGVTGMLSNLAPPDQQHKSPHRGHTHFW